MYGTRQFGGMDHGWVANFAIRTVMKRPITIFGTSKQVRDILYASDAARAFSLWWKKGKPETYNIGGGPKNAVSLCECLNLLHQITGIKQDITIDESREMDLWYFVCDISKAEKDFGWTPVITNAAGVYKLVEWIEENKELF